jgi:myo-inositol 2-dehydrogenase/D-chiro-inositol 1-dehydrogenase
VDPEIGKAGDLDTAIISMRFANGALGSIDNCRKAVFGYDQRAEVLGSDGMISVDNDRPNTARLSTSKAVQEDLPLFFFLERYTEAFVAEIKEFVRCVKEGVEPPVSGMDGRASVVMAKAARLSYDKGRPVKLSEIG